MTMTSSPAVTIVTPTKNRRVLLAETMDSVRRQTLVAWEHIIVDDGSDDGTAEVVSRRAESDPRVRYLMRTGQRTGANVCRNHGLASAAAGLIVFLDSDDMLRPHCLERRVEVMSRNADLDFAVFRAGVFIKSIGDVPRLYHDQAPGDDLLRFLSLDCIWEISGPIWRREFLKRIGGFDEEALSMQDLEMHVRAICSGGKYIFLRDVDHDIRGQDDSTRTSTRHFRDPAYIEAAARTWDSLFHTVKNAGLLTWSRHRAILGQNFSLAQGWIKIGRGDRATKTWAKGCGRNGTRLVWLLGLAMLLLLRCAPGDAGVVGRLVNKWKGWVRFRQEPKPLKVEVVSETQPSYLGDPKLEK